MKESTLSILQKCMEAFMQRYRSLQYRRLKIEGSLEFTNQPAIQTNEFGKKKFKYGLETTWLQCLTPNRRFHHLARLTETTKGLEFQLLADNPDEIKLIEDNLEKMKELMGVE